MSTARTVLAVVVSAAGALTLAASSGVSVPWHSSDAAELRLSWSARPEQIETCRVLSEEELATRPVHMRRARECEGQPATYDLEVVVDETTLDNAIVRGSGIRSDRPIFLLRSYPLAEGVRRVQVSLARREPPDSLADTAATSQRVLARRVQMDTIITVQRGTVLLVTYGLGRFVVRAP